MSATEQPRGRSTPARRPPTWRPQQFSEGRSSNDRRPDRRAAVDRPARPGPRRRRRRSRSATRRRPGRRVRGRRDGARARRAARPALLVDGYLTHQPLQAHRRGRRSRDRRRRAAAPSIGQMWFGSIGRRRSRRAAAARRARSGASRSPADEDVALVAVDLLWLDDEPLLDVPLLERKRILESVVGESRLVRRGIYVRPPVDRGSARGGRSASAGWPTRARTAATRPARRTPQWAVADLPLAETRLALRALTCGRRRGQGGAPPTPVARGGTVGGCPLR